jgi:hypothetical protein
LNAQRSWIIMGVATGVAFSGAALCAQPPPPAPAAQAQMVPAARTFGSDAGLVLNFIKPDKIKDFETLIGKLKEVLANSDKPLRREQARSWKVFKSSEPAAGGAAVYVFFSDPIVKSADYAVTTILSEALPADEASALVRQYSDCFATGQNWLNLALVSDLGK